MPRNNGAQQRIKVSGLMNKEFKLSTFNQNISGLIGWSFEMPAASYSGRCA
jgi:hypothetical protein